ncbi:iron-sulfur cluster regulator IscR [Halorhodospira halochloris]|uniref:Iron-sulfur cluster regulator IscR n=1 Tax=Halorhodospira halochloris TaxID=1052 RepID=A0A110B5B6_HALHR|nr:SUF system Fe-S cluster assembly regulator [Halorhodospira halochloris]MBK1651472.1 SUF system Fe-S cluster assembly regulator [Halorhodospira halochloris]BAU57267.1 iron-sulfur cluster regulator IscR [Halorhodospira halochloris]
MLRINRETDYGVLILSAMARVPEQRASSAQLAYAHGLPQPIVSKVMKQLVHAGLLCSFRGTKGGYGLSRTPDQVNILEVIEALEGPIAITDCVENGTQSCAHAYDCNAGAAWSRISDVVRTALQGVTLEQMGAPQEQSVTFHNQRSDSVGTGANYGVAEE